MPTKPDMPPMVSALFASSREGHVDDGEYYYYDDEGNYNDPYYNYGSEFSAWLSSVDWELVGTWAIIIFAYFALSMIGPWVWPPAIICLWLTSGDLETCSLGIWSNGYRDEDELCKDREWTDELSDEMARCYLDRYQDLQEEFGANNLCSAKIHWEEYGKEEDRDANCY